MRIMINLIGEQPIPNLLPVLYLKPDKSLFLYTPTTEIRAKSLKEIVPNSFIKEIDPYDFKYNLELLSQEFNVKDIFICNVTGGTKIMSQSLFQLALAYKGEIVYLQSEGNQSVLFKYIVNQENNLAMEKIILPELITASDYIKAHIPYYDTIPTSNDSGGRYEKVVTDVLKENGFEVINGVKPRGEGNQLEIDAVIRLKGTNNTAIAEIKIGDAEMRNPKKGIDQLGLAGQREYLGTYTKRFLITERRLTKQIKELAKAHNIIVIDEIEQELRANYLTKAASSKLLERLKEKLK